MTLDQIKRTQSDRERALGRLATGDISETQARDDLRKTGLSTPSIDKLIAAVRAGILKVTK